MRLLNAVLLGIRRFARHVNLYLSGVMGADAYRKYVEHHRDSGHQGEHMTEREFWRDRTDRQDSNPQGRCC